MTERADFEEEKFQEENSGSARLFDLRYLIGGLMTIYGIVLIIVGFFDSDAEVEKAAGIRINLWMGIGMLILGLLFLLWARTRPLRVDTSPSAAEQAGIADDGPPVH
jgi:hypothetical membrane protein